VSELGSRGVQVDVLHFADIPMPHGYVFRPTGGRTAKLSALVRPSEPSLLAPCLAYVVRHPQVGNVLIDTGLHPNALKSLRSDFGPMMGAFFRGLRPCGGPFDQQLQTVGVDPQHVSSVIMTHLHVDHTSGMRLLERANFVVAEDEWTSATGRRGAWNGYVRGHLPEKARVRLVDFDEEGEPYGPFPNSLDLLGDGTIRLLSTPGHTRGHMSVLLCLDDRRALLVVGDAAYTRRSIDEQLLPLLSADDRASRESLERLKAFEGQEPQALMVPSHDPEAWRALTPQAEMSPRL
jgi:N-acyl homoserine lactone hydrolase